MNGKRHDILEARWKIVLPLAIAIVIAVGGMIGLGSETAASPSTNSAARQVMTWIEGPIHAAYQGRMIVSVDVVGATIDGGETFDELTEPAIELTCALVTEENTPAFHRYRWPANELQTWGGATLEIPLPPMTEGGPRQKAVFSISTGDWTHLTSNSTIELTVTD